MKQCQHCRDEKLDGEFNKNRSSSDGLSAYCKPCRSVIRRTRRMMNNFGDRHSIDFVVDIFPVCSTCGMTRVDKDMRDSRCIPCENARSRRHYMNNKEYYMDKNRKWRRQNPERLKQHLSRRYARRKGADGDHALEQWEELCDRYDNKCLMCGRSKKLTKDHIVPLSKGGSNDISNIQPLCVECNASKACSEVDLRSKVGILN